MQTLLYLAKLWRRSLTLEVRTTQVSDRLVWDDREFMGMQCGSLRVRSQEPSRLYLLVQMMSLNRA